MKIRSVGLNLSGGKGLSSFLTNAGFSTRFFYPWQNLSLGDYSEDISGANSYLDYTEESYDAIIDIPYCFSYEHAFNKDPETKFIYIKKDIESWIKSFKNTQVYFSHTPSRIFEELFCNIYINTGKTKMQDLTEEELRVIYTSHDDAVSLFFENNSNFLNVDLNDSEISNKLKTFLSIDKDVTFIDIEIP